MVAHELTHHLPLAVRKPISLDDGGHQLCPGVLMTEEPNLPVRVDVTGCGLADVVQQPRQLDETPSGASGDQLLTAVRPQRLPETRRKLREVLQDLIGPTHPLPPAPPGGPQ